MKTIYLLICLLVAVLLSNTAHSQTQTKKYKFKYDLNGNRKNREVSIVYLNSAKIPTDSLQAKKPEKPIEDEIGLQQTRIYPNPTKGLLRIEFPDLTDQQPIIDVYDPNGRQIVRKQALSTGNEVDLSSYPSGTYIMIIHVGQEKKDWKIIKQ